MLRVLTQVPQHRKYLAQMGLILLTTRVVSSIQVERRENVASNVERARIGRFARKLLNLLFQSLDRVLLLVGHSGSSFAGMPPAPVAAATSILSP